MMTRRVVVTGIGAVTTIGHGRQGLWKGVQRGESAVRSLTRFDPSPYRARMAAEVDINVADYLDRKQSKRLDRFAQFAVIAARMAVEDAGLRLPDEPPGTVGVIMGSALGGITMAETQYLAYLQHGLRAVNPALALAVFGASCSCTIAIDLGITGTNSTNSNSCSAGTIALGEAFRLIRAGHADVVLAGGAEAPITPLSFGAFDVIRAMSTANDKPSRAYRPFDRDRDGFVMAEGAAVLALEELQHAVRRGATIIGEVRGYGLTNDAHHMTAPHPQGEPAAQAMRLALQEAQVAPEAIGYVNAHGSSTPLNDKVETRAIKQVLGAHAYAIPISSTKALHAHAFGATGVIEVAICCLAFDQHYLPPTINYVTPDPECDLNYLPNQGMHMTVDYILKNSFGFGGINASLVLQRYRPEHEAAHHTL
jgi:3-oxoacyl-[acyl-carrier-protein] synthase II